MLFFFADENSAQCKDTQTVNAINVRTQIVTRINAWLQSVVFWAVDIGRACRKSVLQVRGHACAFSTGLGALTIAQP